MSEVWWPLVEDGRDTLSTHCSAESRRARDRKTGRQGTPPLRRDSRWPHVDVTIRLKELLGLN